MQCETIALISLEELHSGRLLHPALQNTAHTFDRRLSEFIRLSTIVVYAPISLIQAPYRGSAIYTFAHASDRLVGRDLREQTSYATLITQQLSLDYPVVYVQLFDSVLIIGNLEEHIGVQIYHTALPHVPNLRGPAVAKIQAYLRALPLSTRNNTNNKPLCCVRQRCQ